jgi:hypothetical protein
LEHAELSGSLVVDDGNEGKRERDVPFGPMVEAGPWDLNLELFFSSAKFAAIAKRGYFR